MTTESSHILTKPYGADFEYCVHMYSSSINDLVKIMRILKMLNIQDDFEHQNEMKI